MPIFRSNTIAAKTVWRANSIGQLYLRSAICDEGNGTTNFGLIQAGTVMAALSSGKVRPCGLAEASALGSGVNAVTVNDASNFYVGDVISILAAAPKATAIVAGDNPSNLTVTPRVTGISVDIVVTGNNTALSDSYDAATGRITINSATGSGGAATTTTGTVAGILAGKYAGLIASAVAETAADLVVDVGPTALVYTGDAIASARTVSSVDKSTETITFGGGAVTFAAGAVVKLDAAYQPAGILEDILNTVSFETGVEVGVERPCTLALSGVAVASNCTGLGTEGKALLAGGLVSHPALSTSPLTSKVLGFLFE